MWEHPIATNFTNVEELTLSRYQCLLHKNSHVARLKTCSEAFDTTIDGESLIIAIWNERLVLQCTEVVTESPEETVVCYGEIQCYGLQCSKWYSVSWTFINL